MKIAIFHQFLDNIGGAEKVTLSLARELKADVYTTNIQRDKIIKMGYLDILPRIKSIGKVPKNAPFKHQFASLRFRLLNLKGKYDLFLITGDWAVSASKKNKPSLYYCHTPPRELFDLQRYVEENILTKWQIPLFRFWTSFNRFLFRRYTKSIDRIICNSKNTQRRIKKYLGINVSVINPPVELSSYKNQKQQNYWLSVNRLFHHKRIDLQMKVFSALPKENLVIVGSYEKGSDSFEQYKKYIEDIKPVNVKILHWVSDKKLKDLYSSCKGLICTAQDEDFGLTPLEAMASGKPVIATAEGGYKETILDGKTGILIKNIKEESLINAIKKLDRQLKINPNLYNKICKDRADVFDIKNFVIKIKKEIDSINKN